MTQQIIIKNWNFKSQPDLLESDRQFQFVADTTNRIVRVTLHLLQQGIPENDPICEVPPLSIKVCLKSARQAKVASISLFATMSFEEKMEIVNHLANLKISQIIWKKNKVETFTISN